MVGQEWVYTLVISETDVGAVRRVDVDVAFADRPDDIVGSVAGFIGPSPDQRAIPSISALTITEPDGELTEGELQ